jgi:hypothetical protein
MPNVAKVLREEIQRLAKRQVRVELKPVRRDNVRLRKIVADFGRDHALRAVRGDLPAALQ